MIDVSECVNDVIYRLGFQSLADLEASGNWVLLVELYQWADEAAGKVAYESGVFLTWDTSITAESGTAIYNLPASHVFTLAAWLGNSPQRMTTVSDLWALAAAWPATSGPAARASLDAGGVGTLTLYPVPTAGGTVGQIAEEYPPTIAAGSSQVALPSILQDYFSYAMLAGARGKESDAAKPEIAAHCQARMELYDQVIQHLYGPGQ